MGQMKKRQYIIQNPINFATHYSEVTWNGLPLNTWGKKGKGNINL